MESSTADFLKTIEKSKDILVALSDEATDDDIVSAFGLIKILTKKQKEVLLLFSKEIPERLKFLEEPKKITKNIDGGRDFLLIFKTDRNPIMGSSIEEKEGEYIIRITPKKGSINPRDFYFKLTDFKYDLLITLGVPNLESLGKIYEKNTDLFFEVPKINIDNHSSNDQFGQINLVDMTASSVSEIIADIFLEEEKIIDKQIAENFLAGIISATNSFQKATTTPKAMVTAAKLMKHGADQALIIRHLYKTKPISFLKLWGRVMARLSMNEESRLAWSLISTEDFTRSQADESVIPFVLEEIQKNFNNVPACAIFYNNIHDETRIMVRCNNEKTAAQIAEKFGLTAEKNTIKITYQEKNLLEAEKDFLEKIK